MKKFIPALLATSIAATLSVALPVHAAVQAASQDAVQDTTAASANTASMDQVDNAMAQAAQPEPFDPGLKLEELIEDFMYSPMGQSLSSRPDVILTVGQAWVMSKPESRDWGNARVMAYKEALLNAQAKYVQRLGVTVMSESLAKLYDDKSKMPSFSATELQAGSKFGELLDKAVAVAGGKLDEQLQAMGIDPEEFKAAPKEKRATMFERSVSESTITRARQSLTGVIPVKTFEAYDEQGNHAVAVAIVASERFRQFVYDISHSKGDMAPNPDKAASEPLAQMLRKDKASLLNDFGIRRMYDEQGYPVLISFGQSSNPYRGSDMQMRANERDLSYKMAKNSAYANFAYLFNATGVAEEKTTSVMKNKRIGIVRAEGQDVTESEQETREFINAVDSEISARGKVSNLPGTQELFRWTTKHPINGHEINGVVYMWHPLAEQSARQLRDFKPTKTTQTAAAKQPEYKGESGTTQSRSLMSADDF